MQPNTSRRALLAGLAASPAALIVADMPSALTAAPMTSSEAPIVAQARVVARLKRLQDLAYYRLARRSDAAQMARSSRPVAPEHRDLCTAVWEDVDAASPFDEVLRYTRRRPTPEQAIAKQRYVEAVAAWEAECERLREASGAQEADDLCGHLSHRLDAEAAKLTAMPATTVAGLAAKALACIGSERSGEIDQGWENALAMSALCDAIAMGGQAVA